MPETGGLREETTRCGALLVFDEVVTSRLHPGGMHGALGLRPDLVTLGKYIGGGMSFGAFGGRRQVMEMFDPRTPDSVPHSGTFNNNAVTMRVAHAGLSRIYTPEAATELNARGDRLRAALNALAQAYQAPLQFTGAGSVMCAHMTARPVLSPEDAARGDPELRDLMFFDLLARGIYIAKRGMVCLALTTSDLQIERLEAAVRDFLETRRALFQPGRSGC